MIAGLMKQLSKLLPWSKRGIPLFAYWGIMPLVLVACAHGQDNSSPVSTPEQVDSALGGDAKATSLERKGVPAHPDLYAGASDISALPTRLPLRQGIGDLQRASFFGIHR
jgi:hypothetical protein